MTEIKQEPATSLKPGRYVIFEDIACTVKSVQLSKPGKHGSMKCRVEAVGIMDGRKIIKVMPGSENVSVPIIEKKNAQVLSIQGDKATVMDMDNYETFDLNIPEELKDQVKEGCQVMYWEVLNDKLMKQLRA